MKIEYNLIRSSRKTICISIRDNRVFVRAPMHTSIKIIEEFVNKKRNWIISKLSVNTGYSDLCDYKYIYVKGVKVPLFFGQENLINEDCVKVKNLSCLKKLYIENFGEEFLKLFNRVSEVSGLKAKCVTFRAYKARWGCCDNKKQIVFNYKLLMLPTDLWKCVIVHELCHTVFMDHSKEFHILTQQIMPDYNLVHRKLKRYSFITRLY